MLQRVTSQETDTFDEVNKVLNRLIDNVNLIEGKVLALDETTEKKKVVRKHKKGQATVKILTTLVIVLLLGATAFGEFQQITFSNVSNDNVLTLILRERLSFAGGTYTFGNGLTIDNVTDNKLEFNENSDELIMTFGGNAVTFSSADVLTIGFGTLYQTFDQISAPVGNPTGNKGWLYVKDNGGTTDLYFEDDTGAVIELTASASGVANLDEAYDGGGSGTGRTITADSGAMVLNNTDADAAFLLSVTPTPGSSAAAGGIQITSGGNSTQDSLQIVNSGTGDDIQAGAGAFTLSKTGVLVTLSLDATGAGGLTLQNDETVTNSTETEITFTDSASSEDIIIDLDAGSNAVGWKSGSGVDEWAFGDVDDLTGVSTIVFDAADGFITHTPDADDEDLTIQQNGTTKNTSIIVTTAGTGADALQLTASAGGIDISATSSDAGDDIDITAIGTSVNISSTENVADSIVIQSDNAGIDIIAAGAAAGEDIDITATGSSINIISTENQGNAVVIDASDAAGGIDMDYGTGGMVLTGNGIAANLTIDVDALSFDFTDSSNISVTSSEAAEDLTISQIGANNSSLILTAAGTGVDAIQILATAGGMRLTVSGSSAADDLTLASDSAVNITSSEATDLAINIATSNVSGQIQITSADTSDDGIEVDSAGGIDIDAADDITIDIAGAAGQDFLVTNTGGSMIFTTTEPNATDAISFVTSTRGSVAITGGLTTSRTIMLFDHEPMCSAWGKDGTAVWGGIASGTAADENLAMWRDGSLIYHIIGTASILGPIADPNGYDLSLDDTNADGAEYCPGYVGEGQQVFTTGTDACYVKVTFTISDVSGFSDCAIGFRLQEDFQNTIEGYDSYNCLSVASGTINHMREINGGSAVDVDSGESWADNTSHTLEVRIDAAKNVTYFIDGDTPGTPVTHSWTDSSEQIVPFFYFINSADVGGPINVTRWETGLQN